MSQRLRNPAAVVPYSVVGLPDPSATPGLWNWYKGDDLTGSDGAAISSWPNYNATNNATQANGAVQPVKKTGIISGRSVARFTQDELTMATGFPDTSTGTVMVVVSNIQSGNVPVYMLSNNASTSLFGVQLIGSDYIPYLTCKSPSGSYTGAAAIAAPLTAPRLLTFSMNGGAVDIYEGKTLLGSGSLSGSINFDRIGFAGDWDVAEIVISTSALTGTEIQQLYDNYFQPRFAL
jgi:hypothetical protein